ncbi:MAG TPA: hypothetical protein VMQ58_01990 [Candidatus Saccharimonadales bacterium]|nr:hypothetical protein [Candidatus Saccharimonadales bacterium]
MEGGGFVTIVLGLIVAVILIVAIAMPIISTVVANGGFTGITSTILTFLLPFLAMGALIIVAKTVMNY